MGSRGQTTQSIPFWAQPFASSLLPTATGLVSPGAPDQLLQGNLPLKPFDPALEQKVAGFNPAQMAGLGVLEGTAGANLGVAATGMGELNKTLLGDYLSPDKNPFLGQTFDAASRGVVNQYQNATAPGAMVAAQQGGVAGGSADTENQASNKFSLGQTLSDLAAQIYGGNYSRERGIQAAAPGMVGAAQQSLAAPAQQLLGAGTLQQGQTQTELDTARQNAELKTQYPFQLLSFLGNMLGTATGGGGAVTASTSK